MNVAVVYLRQNGETLAHPVHQEWAQDVGADPVYIERPSFPSLLQRSVLADSVLLGTNSTATLSNYDVVLIEPPAGLYALPRADLSETTVIFLHTSWRLAGADAHSFAELPHSLRPVAAADRWVDATVLQHLIARYVDGVLTISDLLADQIRAIADVPIRCVYPHMDTGVEQTLRTVTPAYESNTAVTVGKARGHKGVDRLVDVWPQVRATHPGATLHIVGAGHPDSHEATDGVRVRGYVDDLSDAFAPASLYIHPARLDGFALSVAEAMYAGLPAIVTSTTGAKELVYRVDSSFVTNNSGAALVTAVSDYFDRSPAERERLGETSRAHASCVCHEAQAGAFADVFTDLCTTLGVDTTFTSK